MFRETAPAKINLNLHVGPLVEDRAHKYFGYHPLSSLVVFADYGDELSCERADVASLEISGPFSKGLETGADNLILRAYAEVAKAGDIPPLKFHLIKNLPVASGIGGGSADAAAALRLMQNYLGIPADTWFWIAGKLGADVPVCFFSRTCVMSGTGEIISAFPEQAQTVAAVLVNPGSPVSTAAVFRAFDKMHRSGIAPQASGDLLERFAGSRNDLQSVAEQVNPDITTCLAALGDYPARMSGSGATCFALTPSRRHAEKLADAIQSRYSDWWVQPVMLGNSL